MSSKSLSSKKQRSKDDDSNKTIKFKCTVTILAGRDLAPKDRIMGIGASSDPYVEVWANGTLHGATPVKKITLNPVWDNDNEFIVQMAEAFHLPPPKLELKIWDEDIASEPDKMGVVTLIVPARNDDTTEWYQVPKHSAKNAKGELKVRIRTVRMRDTRGDGKSRKGRGGKSPKRGKSPPRAKSSAVPKKSKSPMRNKSAPVKHLPSLKEENSPERNSPSPSPPRRSAPVERKPRRSMSESPDLPEMKIHECDKILNEDTYWDERLEELGWEIEDLQERIAKSKPFAQHPNTRNSIVPIVEHLQQEVQVRTKEKEKRMQEQMKERIHKLQVKVTIIQGIGLVAKDQDEYGNWVSSDPYVEVWKDRKILGKTRTEEQTLDPIWNEQFVFVVNRRILPKIALRLWDEDYDDEPDCLGTVTLKIPTDEMEITEWYEVPRLTNADKDASGFIQVRIETDLEVDKKERAEDLQKYIHELEQELKESLLVSQTAAPQGRNSLEPTMQYLLDKNKELIKETVQE